MPFVWILEALDLESRWRGVDYRFWLESTFLLSAYLLYRIWKSEDFEPTKFIGIVYLLFNFAHAIFFTSAYFLLRYF